MAVEPPLQLITTHPLFWLLNNQHVVVSGDGHSDYSHGIKVDGTGKQGASGFSVEWGSSNITLQHLEANRASFAGFVIKTNPTCDEKYNRGNFVMENINLHNNVANHNNAEGFYIGSTRFSEGETKRLRRRQY